MQHKLQWDPSLKKVFKGCEVWWQHFMVKHDELGIESAKLREELDAPGRFIGGATLHLIWHTYQMQSSILAGKNDIGRIPQPLRYGVKFRELEFRKTVGKSLPHPHQPLRAFKTGCSAVGPAMLSDWPSARLCAEQLIAVAEKEQRDQHPEYFRDRWGCGGHDAFVIALLSQGFDTPTSYQPARPMVQPYRQLLDVWRAEDEAAFQAAMQAACAFHIKNSLLVGGGGDSPEFEYPLDIVFAVELLAVQALRRRDGLPEFSAGHLLVDTPWSIVRDLPQCEPHPLAVEVEQRLKQDFPSFR